MDKRMKDSGVKWLGSVPSEWEVGKVKHYYKLQTGFTPDTKKEEFYDDDNGYDWVNISDIQDGKVINETKKKISQLYVDQFSPTQIPVDSLLFSFKLSVGQTAFAGKPLYSNEAIAAFTPSDDIDLHFLRYSSFMIMENAEVNIYNARILNRERINNAYIVFPPLMKQRRIASFLDAECARIDSVIEQTRASIEEYKKLKQAVITRAVTKGIRPDRAMKDSGIEWIGEIPADWNVRRLRYLCKITTGNQDTQDKNPDGRYPFYVRSPIVERSDIWTFEGPAILMAGDGVGAGRIFHYVDGKYGCHQRVYCMQNINQISRRFLFYYLRELFYISMETANSKSTVDSVRLPMLQDFPVLMSGTEETEIVNYLEDKTSAIDMIISKRETFLVEIEEYKKSFIYEYVTGKKEAPL